jgi:hypothetical protein
MELNHHQASVLKLIFERADIEGDMDILRFALAGEFQGSYVIAATERSSDGSYIAFNLPTYAPAVFVARAKSNIKAVSLIIANLEDYARESARPLHLGDAVIMPGTSGEWETPYAVILLRLETLTDTAGVPDVELIADRETSFFLVVPLDQEEYRLREDFGHDALLDAFEFRSKDISL